MATAATQNIPLAGYETTFITRSELGEDALKALSDRLLNVVAEYKGELVLTEDWGTKKLAYKIEKESRGRYTYMVYTGRGDIVAEIERNLRLHDHVLRFLSVNLAREFERDTFLKQREEQKAQAKKREEEREARREERNAERRRFEPRDGRDSEESFSDVGSEGSEE